MNPSHVPVMVALLLGGALWAGCLQKGEPSPAFRDAQVRFNELYGRELEDAYVRPEMAAIEAQLEAVPKESSDWQRADELLKRIRSGRERVSSRRAEREEELARALEPAQLPPPSPEERAAEAVEAPPDGGAPFPVEEMPVAELTSRFADCFASGSQILLNDAGLQPSWTLKEQPGCRERFPQFEQKVVVAQGDRIFAIVDQSRLEIRTVDGGVPR